MCGFEGICPEEVRNKREWLSWWSTTLPRSGSRVRVPSRALHMKRGSRFLVGSLFFCARFRLWMTANYEYLDIESTLMFP